MGVCRRDPAHAPSLWPGRASSPRRRGMPRRVSASGLRRCPCPEQRSAIASSWRSRSCLSPLAWRLSSCKPRICASGRRFADRWLVALPRLLRPQSLPGPERKERIPERGAPTDCATGDRAGGPLGPCLFGTTSTGQYYRQSAGGAEGAHPGRWNRLGPGPRVCRRGV